MESIGVTTAWKNYAVLAETELKDYGVFYLQVYASENVNYIGLI